MQTDWEANHNDVKGASSPISVYVEWAWQPK